MKIKISLVSWFLVALQVLCLGYLYISAPMKAIRVDLQIWELSGLFLSLSGLIGLNWKSFSVFPEPRPKGKLITSGIFAFIRHPMYAGILVMTATLVLQFYSLSRLCCWAVLASVFVVKILREEKYLSALYPEYDEYKRQTNRLIPFVW